jgi:hypothetical protein
VQVAKEEATAGDDIGSCQQQLWCAVVFNDGGGVQWCAAVWLFPLVAIRLAAEEDEETASAMVFIRYLIFHFAFFSPNAFGMGRGKN